MSLPEYRVHWNEETGDVSVIPWQEHDYPELVTRLGKEVLSELVGVPVAGNTDLMCRIRMMMDKRLEEALRGEIE